jgi:glucosamine kinase
VLLGIDAGGTSTVALLATSDLEPVARAQGRSAAFRNVGLPRAVATIRATVARLPRAAPPYAVCVGMAGIDVPGDAERMLARLAPVFRGARLVVCNDALIALRAGTDARPGIVIIAGTGSIAYGVGRDGREARAGGWGPPWSDQGSGVAIGIAAVRVVFETADGRRRTGVLSRHVLDALALRDVDALFAWLHRKDVRRQAIALAALAPAVERAARDGDPAASVILAQAGRDLADLGAAVVRTLGLRRRPVDVVLAGGVFNISIGLMPALRRRLAALAPAARVRRAQREPAWGAVAIARDLAARRRP